MLLFENFKQEDLIKFITDEINEKTEKNIDEVLFNDFQSKLEEHKNSVEKSDKLTLEEAVYNYQTNNDNDAFDYIYKHYHPVLERLAYRKNDEDLVTELSEVLWNAVRKFDINAGTKFNTFFWTCAQNHIGTQKIRKNAQKRSGAKKVETKVINSETGEEEVVVEVVKTKVVSLQSTLNSKDSDTEIGSFIESGTFKNQYNELELNICLKQLYNDGHIKPKEMRAIQMICEGAKLNEIGQELNGVTPPAIFVMLRRLGKKTQVRKRLREILL